MDIHVCICTVYIIIIIIIIKSKTCCHRLKTYAFFSVQKKCSFSLSYIFYTSIYIIAIAHSRAYPANSEKQPRMYYEDSNIEDNMTFVKIKYLLLNYLNALSASALNRTGHLTFPNSELNTR